MNEREGGNADDHSVLSSEGVVWVVDYLLACLVIAPYTIHSPLVTCAMKHNFSSSHAEVVVHATIVITVVVKYLFW